MGSVRLEACCSMIGWAFLGLSFILSQSRQWKKIWYNRFFITAACFLIPHSDSISDRGLESLWDANQDWDRTLLSGWQSLIFWMHCPFRSADVRCRAGKGQKHLFMRERTKPKDLRIQACSFLLGHFRFQDHGRHLLDRCLFDSFV